MATYTTYKSLEKPLSIEKYDVAVANKNNDVIDSELHKLDIKNKSQDELLATKESLNSEITRATNKENNIVSNLTSEIARAKSAENSNTKKISDEITRALSSERNIELSLQEHILDENAHNDIRLLISELTTRLNTLADSDDTTLDQLSEIVAYIKNNKSLIDSITTNKVNVSAILNNLIKVQNNTTPGKLVDALVVKEVFQNVSDGKSLIASAITDKGVSTDANDTFAVMADNIGKIETSSSLSKILTQRIYYDVNFDAYDHMRYLYMYMPDLNIEKVVIKDTKIEQTVLNNLGLIAYGENKETNTYERFYEDVIYKYTGDGGWASATLPDKIISIKNYRNVYIQLFIDPYDAAPAGYVAKLKLDGYIDMYLS